MVKVIIGILMVCFALFELLPRFEELQFDRKWLPLGGVISGFLGGLSGHQGALRSALLSKAGLTKESFIATGVVIAFLIDLTRITVYSGYFSMKGMGQNLPLISAAVLAAFIGAFAGSRLLKKITLKAVQITVGIMLIIFGCLLGIGLL